MDDELIAAHGDLPELMPYLHLPVQSGSDRILKAMNRRHTAADYLRLIERIRAARPDIAMSGDFIVGFPGETDADFEATLQLVRDVGYASGLLVQIFPAPRHAGGRDEGPGAGNGEGRAAAKAASIAASSSRVLLSHRWSARPSTLIEKPGRQAGQIVGRSPWLQPVIVDEKAGRIGDIIDVRITKAAHNSLFARKSA